MSTNGEKPIKHMHIISGANLVKKKMQLVAQNTRPLFEFKTHEMHAMQWFKNPFQLGLGISVKEVKG